MTKNQDHENQWQIKMVPLMSRMLIGLTIFFFFVSLVQLSYLLWNIQQLPVSETNTEISKLNIESMSFDEKLKYEQFLALADLDLSAMERRHHQANVLLMARVWTRYMGFITGMILTIVGAVFILGKLREPNSEVELKQANISANIKSTSPGIILSFLGVVLMIITIVVHHRIEVKDAPTYLRILGDTSNEKPMITSPK